MHPHETQGMPGGIPPRTRMKLRACQDGMPPCTRMKFRACQDGMPPCTRMKIRACHGVRLCLVRVVDVPEEIVFHGRGRIDHLIRGVGVPEEIVLVQVNVQIVCRACQDWMPPCTLFELVIRVAIVVFMEQLASGVIAERPNEGRSRYGALPRAVAPGAHQAIWERRRSPTSSVELQTAFAALAPLRRLATGHRNGWTPSLLMP